MAALDTPWTATPTMSSDQNSNTAGSGANIDLHCPPTIAAFSPVSASPASRLSFQVHQKYPLLAATPPQVTRSLSKAYPWIRSLDFMMGLLTWTSSDPWESFLMVAFFWAVVLYGEILLRWAGNLIAVAVLITVIALRNYHTAPTSITFDEILSALNSLNRRMEIFFAPVETLLGILSLPKNATASTTVLAATRLFTRILCVSPVWILLAVYPSSIFTPKRIVLFVGTLLLSWHSRPAKVARTIIWRSVTFRKLSEMLTGLSLTPEPAPPSLPPRDIVTCGTAAAAVTATPSGTVAISKSTPLTANTDNASPGVKFTFAIYENQRRWLGVGWTSSLFTYERAAWTDEHLQACPPPQEFTLPGTAINSGVYWRWVSGEDWAIEGAVAETVTGCETKKQHLRDKLGGPGCNGEGWWYYDNKWRDETKGVDGWGKYTRRRKWVRSAELVEVGEIMGEMREEEEDWRGTDDDDVVDKGKKVIEKELHIAGAAIIVNDAPLAPAEFSPLLVVSQSIDMSPTPQDGVASIETATKLQAVNDGEKRAPPPLPPRR